MRLFIIPIILVTLLIQISVSALGNGNQEAANQAAEKIADAIGARFPDAEIDVWYQQGQVWLAGEAGSQDQKKKIVELVSKIPGVAVEGVEDTIQVVAAKAPVPRTPTQTTRPAVSAINAPIPLPTNSSAPKTNERSAPLVAMNTRQDQLPQAQAVAVMAPYPQQQYPAAYGLNPGQQPAVSGYYTPNSYTPIPMGQQPAPQYAQQQHQPAYYGSQGPLPGRYNQPNLPNHAWPAYANYPNYAQVSYPRMYSPKAWPYIGPFYPYPQVPLGWRKVTLEHHNGGWWLDFDDGAPSGPFSGLFRQPAQYTY